MLKKVSITNAQARGSLQTIVDTDTHEKALIGAAVAANETATIEDITGVDEAIHRLTLPKDSLEDRVKFFGGLGRCLERNIGVIKSLQLQASRVSSPKYRGTIAEMVYDLSIGEKFSDAIGKHPTVFPPEVYNLVVAGEEAGQLGPVCKRIGNSQKKTARIIKKLKTGMIYPAIVLVLGVGVVIIMSFTLVPAMEKLYTQMNAVVPMGTKILLGLSNILLHQPWLVLLPIFGLYQFFKNWGKISAIPAVQTLFLKLPVVGNLVRKSAAALTFRTLAMLVEANVRLSGALEITANSAWHWHYRTFFQRLADHIAIGTTLHEAFLIESHWLGRDGRSICGLIELASETGSGTEMLNEIADDYEDELDGIAGQIDKILEPITMMFLGVMVGLLVYCIYGPIFSLGDVLLKKG